VVSKENVKIIKQEIAFLVSNCHWCGGVEYGWSLWVTRVL